MIPPVDTKQVSQVAAYVEATFESMFRHSHWFWLTTVFHDVEALFAGRHPEYSAVDTQYHDLEHTLQATLCMSVLLEGWAAADAEPAIDARLFELGITAALLHDTGYLKTRFDTDGTGAKYTFCHVVRSCAFAASYLPNLGADDYEVGTVLSAINCTGVAQISRLDFRQPIEQMLGCALATADLIGQMAAPNYPDKLPILYNEFHESDEFLHVPQHRRLFSSSAELIAKTPSFWEKFVLPRMDHDFGGLYRYLARPNPTGRNGYMEAIESNIAAIRNRFALAESE